MASAEPNVEGAIKVLVDILTANGFTKTRAPYENNFRGLVDAIVDLKKVFPLFHQQIVLVLMQPVLRM